MPECALPPPAGRRFFAFCKIDMGDNKSMSEKTGENESKAIGK